VTKRVASALDLRYGRDMEQDFWQARWDQNQIGFHEAAAHRFLVQFANQLVSPAATAGSHPRVLVPLCGKSLDLIWLRNRGFDVTGIEFVRLAAESFFAEQSLTARVKSTPEFECFESPGLAIWVGDFFALATAQPPAFEAIYDRAALVAIKPEDRARYAATLLGSLAPGGRVLLITFVYEQAEMQGPPFSVTEQTVTDLFAATCSVEQLADEDILEKEARFRERGIHTRLREQAWLITKPK
jgi:thiopurine S-methyltransferase